MNKRTFLLCFVILFTSCKREASHLEEFKGKVIGIKDGDTIEVLFDYKPLVIRLADIDCPENGQAYARNAKRFTSDACYAQTVRIVSNGKKDRYDRLVATIILSDSTILNENLVKAGLAWHYKKYSKKAHFEQLENEARTAKRGLWADEDVIAPWDWRHQ